MARMKRSSQKITQKLLKFFEERRKEILEIVRKIVVEEQTRIKCREVKEALNYFIDGYQHDKIRLALLSMVYGAVEEKKEITKSVIIPLIFISGALDIHDDIINELKSKFGKPTIYGKYGKDIALLVGDMFLFKGLFLLEARSLSKEKRPPVCKLRERTTWILQKEQKTPTKKNITDTIQKMMEERGAKSLKVARKKLSRGIIKNREVQEALDYLITEQWQEISYTLGPTLISLACEAVGGNPEATTQIAASLILMAAGIRIHDDVIDKSKIKRSHLTIFGKFGTATAIIAGRTLIVKGFKLLHRASGKDVSTREFMRIINIIQQSFFEFGSAEALELNLRGNVNTAPQKYMPIIEMKASIYEAQTRVGAIIGGGTQLEVAVLSKYGRILGTLVIIRDEFIDTFEVNELHHRMVNECLPLPVLWALQNPSVKKKLIPILEKEKITNKDMEVLVNMVFKTKEVETLKEKIHYLQVDAYSKLSSLPIKQATKSLRFLISTASKDL